jgi:hypothetical protein
MCTIGNIEIRSINKGNVTKNMESKNATDVGIVNYHLQEEYKVRFEFLGVNFTFISLVLPSHSHTSMHFAWIRIFYTTFKITRLPLHGQQSDLILQKRYYEKSKI